MKKPHRRRSIRLKNYDYAEEGAYFVTICTHQKKCIFGLIADGEMNLSTEGKIVLEEWEQTAILRDNVELDAFVVMPNHIHGIIVITENLNKPTNINNADVGAWRAMPLPRQFSKPIPNSLSSIVGGFKSAVTKRINRLRDTSGAKRWQRNYYEHIIRNETSLNYIRQYCATNPQRWHDDDLYIEGDNL